LATRSAIIDIGSNSVRMLILEKTSRFGFHLLHEEKSRVRLSEDIYKNSNNLQPKAMQRTIDVLKEFATILQSFKARKTITVATSALRDAPNALEFIQRVKKETSLQIKVISGEKEAFFGAIACANLLHVKDAMTLDIGGGSSESAQISQGEIHHEHSLHLGTVRLKELYFDTNNIKEAKKFIDHSIEKMPENDATTLIGIGGTFRALSNLIIEREKYPFDRLHGYEFDAKIMLEFIDEILDADEEELKHLGIKSDRIDVIQPGALILSRIIKKRNIKHLVCSGVGLREGVFLQDLLRSSKLKFPENFNPSVRYLIDAFSSEKNYSNQLAKLSKELFNLLQVELNLDEKYKKAIVIAAKLSKIGSSLHIYSEHLHSHYFIQNTLEYALSHKEIILIAALVRYSKRKRISSEYEEYRSLLPDTKTLTQLTQILAISDVLLSHRPRNIDFTLHIVDNTLHVKSKNKLYLAQEKISTLKLSKPFSVTFESL